MFRHEDSEEQWENLLKSPVYKYPYYLQISLIAPNKKACHSNLKNFLQIVERKINLCRGDENVKFTHPNAINSKQGVLPADRRFKFDVFIGIAFKEEPHHLENTVDGEIEGCEINLTLIKE